MRLLLAIACVAHAACGAWPAQEPFWPHYPSRKVQNLEGSWDFANAVSGVDPTQISYDDALGYIKASSATMDVPKACDVTPPGVEGPRGTFFYRTAFDSTPGKSTLLQFMACSFYCRVFVDGAAVGDHRAGGYAPFWLRAPPAAGSSREVLVVVNNEFNATTAPVHTGGDFYNYAGITRNVLVFEQPDENTYIHSVAPFPVSERHGTIHVKVTLAGPSVPDKVDLALGWNGEPPSAPTTVPVSRSDSSAVLLNLTVPDFQPWAIGDPHLFTLTVALVSGKQAQDAITIRSGIRVLGVSDTSGVARLAINGAVQKLYGVNRHTMWPDTGSGLSLEQVKADVALLQNLGVNWVRGAHYAQDQRFVDLLDETGIGLWEEALGPGTSVGDFDNPTFMKQHLIQMGEMVETSISHPSILYHAFFNEGPSDDPKACFAYNASAAAIRERVSLAGSPPSRLVTWASDKKTRDVCLDIADVISFNDYPCWYGPTGKDGTAQLGLYHCSDPATETAASWLQNAQWSQEHQPGKPFGISETGAGGVYEWSDNATDVVWSQQYEKEVVAGEATFATQNSLVSHFTIWQFNDIKANEGATSSCGQCDYAPHPNNLTVPWNCEYIDVSCGRPGGENHKGQVDFWRREKQSFGALKAIYDAAAKRSDE